MNQPEGPAETEDGQALTPLLPRRTVLGLLGLGGCTPAVVDLLQPRQENLLVTDVEVLWGQPLGPVATGEQYGLNLFLGLDPRTANSPGYLAGLGKMAPGLVRFYRSDMTADADAQPSGWIKAAASSQPGWDRDKIAKLFPGGFAFRPRLMVSLPEWPVGMGPRGEPLAAERHQAFIDLAADLVRVLNVEQKRGVQAFEIWSELEQAYDGRAEEQGALAARVARAMKAVDPSVQVGGPSLVHAWHTSLDAFLRGTEGEIDFVTYHGFGGGSGVDAGAALESALTFGEPAAVVKAATEKRLGRVLPVYQTLYNITAQAPNNLLTGMDSALFDALALRSFVLNGVSGAAAWNEADGWFGKANGDGVPRPAAHVFALFNAHMRGSLVSATSTNPALAVFAVGGGSRGSIALINTGSSGTRARLVETPAGGPTTRRGVHTVTEAGLAYAEAATASLSDPGPLGGVPVPPRSVVVLTFAG